MKKISVLVMSFALAVVLAACAPAADQVEFAGDETQPPGEQTQLVETQTQLRFDADLTPGAEVPAPTLNGATPSGSVTATLNAAEDTLFIRGIYSGLTGPATGAHIHGPAEEGETAGVIFPLDVDASASGNFSGTWEDITAEQIQQLRDGLYYVNVHTEMNPPGEIRGQLE